MGAVGRADRPEGGWKRSSGAHSFHMVGRSRAPWAGIEDRVDESTVLGVDDLVDAFLAPKYNSFASRKYWSAFADHLMAELGRLEIGRAHV